MTDSAGAVTDVVLVTGPRSAGVTSMVEALRRRIPGRFFAEAQGLGPGDSPAAAVFVVSAVAPATGSDCALAELATTRADVVVAVVSKVDDHRDWRGVLAVNRERLAEYAVRFQHVRWVGAAAAPRMGPPLMDDLVELLESQLGDPEVVRKNSLRASEFRLRAEIARLDEEASGADRKARVDALRKSRDELLRRRLMIAPETTIAVRSEIRQARVALTYSARNRCADARTELLETVAGTSRRHFGRVARGDFAQGVRRRCRDLVAEVDDEITTRTRKVAARLRLSETRGLSETLGLPELRPPTPAMASRAIADPPVRSRRLETQLTTVFGAGFGLGVAVLVNKLFAGLAPQATVAALVAGGLAGLAVTGWVVRVRGLLHDRAVLERWVNDVTSAVRAAAEERVAIRLLAAETALSSSHAAGAAAQRRAVGQRIAAIDAELREHVDKTARAESVRDREMPPLLRALQALREPAAQGNPTAPVVTGR